MILDTLVKLYRLCDSEIPLYPVTDITDKESTGTIIRESLLVTLKVLINLTHRFNKHCKLSPPLTNFSNLIPKRLNFFFSDGQYCSGFSAWYHRGQPTPTFTDTSLYTGSKEIRTRRFGIRIFYLYLDKQTTFTSILLGVDVADKFNTRKRCKQEVAG